jgi:hypothetical protein
MDEAGGGADDADGIGGGDGSFAIQSNIILSKQKFRLKTEMTYLN